MPHDDRARRGSRVLWVPCLLPLLGAGCSDHMRLDSNLNGEMAATLKLDGPVEIRMQGPTVRYEGTYISDELLELVDAGETTGEWVIAVFGEPDARTQLHDGSSIWRWTYRPVEQTASVIEIFGDEEKEPRLSTRTVFCQVRDGIVIRKWSG